MAAGALIVEGRIEIARPPQEVFDVLADPRKWSSFDAALVDVEPREPLTHGARGTIRRRAGMGMIVRTAWENTDFVPGTRLENLIRGFGYELRETVDLAASPGGTDVTIVDALAPTSLIGRAMVALSRGFIERDLRARSAQLKSTLEDPARPG